MRVMGSHNVAGKGFVHTENSQMASIGHFRLHISHKAAKSMAKFNSQLCGELQLVACEMDPFKDYLSTGGHLTSHRNKTAKAAWETFSANTCLNWCTI